MKLKPAVEKIKTDAKAKKGLKKKAAKTVVEVSLPTEPSVPAADIGDYVIWVYGSPGIGKTSLASKFDAAMCLMFEPGGKALRLYQRPINSWPEYRAYIKKLKDGGHKFKTTVTDVVELAYQMCFKYMCQKLVITHPSDVEDFGKSWGLINNEFYNTLGELTSIPNMGTVLISHATATKRKTRTGEETEDIHPAISGKPLEALEGAVDLLGYMHIRRGKRVMQIRATDNVMAKCRLEENFRHTDGSPVMYVPLGNSSSESYENFAKAFNNELPPPEKETAAPAKKLGIKKPKK